MIERHALTAVLALLGALTLVAGALAVGTDQLVVVKQQVVAPYRLVLRIGPPEQMAMKGMAGMKGSEVMLGGAMARCFVIDHFMAGMSMGGEACNHHVELHVRDARTGHVVRHAQAAITLYDTSRHMTIPVPIMTMAGSKGIADYHYGNNVYARPGFYRVMTIVNRIQAEFVVHLE